MSVPASATLNLPDVTLDPTALADLELALLAVLPVGHVLGEAVAAPGPSPSERPVAGGPPRVQLRLTRAVADAVAAAGGAVLRDEEHTPLAELSHAGVPVSGVSSVSSVSGIPGASAADVDDSDEDDRSVVSGVLTRRRAREGGEGAQYALSATDLALAPGPRSLVVVARPPVLGDAAALEALAESGDDIVVVVPTGGGSSAVPVPVLLHAAHRLSQVSALGERAVIRTAPLAWRDPDSDSAVVSLLAHALGAARTLHLRPDGEDPASEQWREVRRELDAGGDDPLTGVDASTEAVLRRWRPPRASRGLVVMFTGLSGSGKSTLARDVSAQVLEQTSRTLTLLDGDVVRTMLSSGLGFDRASRILNVRRIGYVAAEIARHGGIAVCAPIAPYAATRAEVRAMAEQVGDFVLVHVSTPLAECERRDLKGLYAKARAGLIPEFTGISDPYDLPMDADLTIDTSAVSREAAAAVVWDHLTTGGWLAKEAL